MATLEQRIDDLERPATAAPVYCVVEGGGKREAAIRAEVDAAHARHPGRSVVVFIKRRE